MWGIGVRGLRWGRAVADRSSVSGTGERWSTNLTANSPPMARGRSAGGPRADSAGPPTGTSAGGPQKKNGDAGARDRGSVVSSQI